MKSDTSPSCTWCFLRVDYHRRQRSCNIKALKVLLASKFAPTASSKLSKCCFGKKHRRMRRCCWKSEGRDTRERQRCSNRRPTRCRGQVLHRQNRQRRLKWWNQSECLLHKSSKRQARNPRSRWKLSLLLWAEEALRSPASKRIDCLRVSTGGTCQGKRTLPAWCLGLLWSLYRT